MTVIRRGYLIIDAPFNFQGCMERNKQMSIVQSVPTLKKVKDPIIMGTIKSSDGWVKLDMSPRNLDFFTVAINPISKEVSFSKEVLSTLEAARKGISRKNIMFLDVPVEPPGVSTPFLNFLLYSFNLIRVCDVGNCHRYCIPTDSFVNTEYSFIYRVYSKFLKLNQVL